MKPNSDQFVTEILPKEKLFLFERWFSYRLLDTPVAWLPVCTAGKNAAAHRNYNPLGECLSKHLDTLGNSAHIFFLAHFPPDKRRTGEWQIERLSLNQFVPFVMHSNEGAPPHT